MYSFNLDRLGLQTNGLDHRAPWTESRAMHRPAPLNVPRGHATPAKAFKSSATFSSKSSDEEGEEDEEEEDEEEEEEEEDEVDDKRI